MSSTASSRTGSVAPTQRARGSNRAALRDYYKIQPASENTEDQPNSPLTDGIVSEIDRPDCNSDAYVERMLQSENLAGLVRTESRLMSEIKSLNGDKKALVYDNYSKLISATDTIKSMRSKMGPRAPTTASLNSAFEDIARTTAHLASRQQKHRRTEQQKTVAWALATPHRMGLLLQAGHQDEAQTQWDQTRVLLEKWQGVPGVADLQDQCLQLLTSQTSPEAKT